MTNASLARKFARLNAFQREARLYRGQGALDRPLNLTTDETADPRALLAEEQDRRREALAERLLEIFAEEAEVYHFTDTHMVTRLEGKEYDSEVPTVSVSEWAVKLAHAALAAATVLYPEVPAEGWMVEVPSGTLVPPPVEAFEGAQSVAPEP